MLERELKEPTDFHRPVSIWLMRHFRPDPHYGREKPLTETAPAEARLAAETILSQIHDGESLVLYGADSQPRHRETLRLLRQELEKQISEGGRQINLIIPASVDHKRGTIRGPGFDSTYVSKAGGPQNLLGYWMQDETLPTDLTRTPAQVAERFSRLANKLVVLARKSPGTKLHFLMVTSGELPAAEMVRGFGTQGMGLAPGQWVRFDINHSISEVTMTSQSGQSSKVDLTCLPTTSGVV
jgi:hypothetical protein